MRRLRAAVLLGTFVLTLVASGQARTVQTDPIAGFWNYGGGVVQVTGGPASFTGTVVQATRFSECVHPVGEVIWRVTKSGTNAYTGTHTWFASAAPECRLGGPAQYGRATWRIDDTGASLVLRFCTTSPTNSTDTRCNDLTRAKPVTLEKYAFTFSAYGNPQRPFPGYVGEFQLGPVRISGSGTATAASGTGTVTLSADLRDRRYPTHRTTWRIVKLLNAASSGPRTILTLQVAVVAHSYPQMCPAGTTGTLQLIDDATKLSNGFDSDGVLTAFTGTPPAPDGLGASCRTHGHGMNNTTVSWTDPPAGGYPNGGNWARVGISTPETPATSGPKTAQAALDRISAILRANRTRCGIRGWRLRVGGKPGNWSAVATVTFRGRTGSGTARWAIVGNRVSARNQLAAAISRGCP